MHIINRINSKTFQVFSGLTIILLVMSPLFYIGDITVQGDGNILMQRLEAMRQTILVYHQWPGLNIWNAGGQPLEGHGGIFPISIKSVFILLFGTKIGLNFSILLYLILGYLGSWLLASLIWKNSVLKNIFSIFVVINLPLLFHLRAGHIIFYVYYLLPLILYYLIQSPFDRWSGIKAGILFGLAFNDTPAYLLQYMSIVLVLVYIGLIINVDISKRKMMCRGLILFIFSLLPIIAYHTITIYQNIIDYPRESNLFFNYFVSDVFKSYLYPFTKIEKAFSSPAGVPGMSCVRSTHEVAAYLGLIGFTLVVISLINGVKWWHYLILFLFIAGLGNDGALYPMYWLQKLPSFSSHLCFSRVRIITHLFLPFAIMGGLWILWSKLKIKKYGRIIVSILGGILILERLIIGFMIIKGTHVNIEKADSFYRSHYEYVGRDNHFINVNVIPPFEATQLNIGILRGGGDSNIPMNNKDADGYEGPIGLDEEGYIAEFHQNGQKIEPDYWSPNRIEFSRLDPKMPLILNLNPSSAWYNNSVQLFPEYKIVEVNKRFEVMPDKDGIILLTYEFPGRKIGVATTVLFFILSIFVIGYFRRKDNRVNVNSNV